MSVPLPAGVSRAASEPRAIHWIDEVTEQASGVDADPAAIMLTCANCGAQMDERKCKLICRCGYFASCSDYY